MNDESAQSVLHRLLRSAAKGAKEPVSSTRALRLALARAAERSVGLTLSVIGVTEEVLSLDELIERVDAEWMLVSIGAGDRLLGFAGLDLQARTAVVEVQTLGNLRGTAAEARPATASDAALCAPFIARFLNDFAHTSEGTPLTGWTEGLAAAARFADGRAARMVLPDAEMRLVRLTLDLGVAERQGLVAIALPMRRAAPIVQPAPSRPRFAQAFRGRVMDAPATLNAVLDRVRLPLCEVEAFEIGQCLALPGVSVRSVRIEAPDGRAVAEGRLGQLSGNRAVRVEVHRPQEVAEVRLADMRALPKAAAKSTGAAFAQEVASGEQEIATGEVVETAPSAATGTT